MFGRPDAGSDMVFNFPQLVAHVAKTREIEAGSIIGSGTVSNKQGGLHGSSIANGGVGYCCLAEVRMYETIETGKPQTPFLKFGDTVRIEMLDRDGKSIFGAIEQQVQRPSPDNAGTSN
jgi:fumarylacetoacetate (FAA) hydrolase